MEAAPSDWKNTEQLQDPLLLSTQRNGGKSINGSNIRIRRGKHGICSRTNNLGLNEPRILNRGIQEDGFRIECHEHKNHGRIDKNQSAFNYGIDRSRSIENTTSRGWRWRERASHRTTKKS